MRVLFASAFAALAVACGPAAPVGPTAAEIKAESEKLTKYLNAEYEEELAMNPLQLTAMGRKEKYDELGDFSEADNLKQLEWRRTSVADMKAQVSRDKLNDDAKTSWDIWDSGAGARGAAAEMDALQLCVRIWRAAYGLAELPDHLSQGRDA